MSFYSYKNSGSTHCPCNLSGNEVFSGLNEKICIQVQRVYDSCLMQEQLKEQKVTLLSYGLVPSCNGSCGEQQENANTQPTMPITFESCRSTSTEGVIRNLSVERLCDRPCFGRVRCQIDVPIDILFTDAACREYIGRGMVTVDRDVLLSIPDESIVPYNIESMVSAICVSGTYLRNNVFELEICVTVVLKVLAKVEVLVPSYGYCEVPPCEEFADSVCDEFFSLPLFPQAVCDEDALRARNVSCTCGNYASSTGLGGVEFNPKDGASGAGAPSLVMPVCAASYTVRTSAARRDAVCGDEDGGEGRRDGRLRCWRPALRAGSGLSACGRRC